MVLDCDAWFCAGTGWIKKRKNRRQEKIPGRRRKAPGRKKKSPRTAVEERAQSYSSPCLAGPCSGSKKRRSCLPLKFLNEEIAFRFLEFYGALCLGACVSRMLARAHARWCRGRWWRCWSASSLLPSFRRCRARRACLHERTCGGGEGGGGVAGAGGGGVGRGVG